MLANGLADPYTRFITTEQFAAMQSYDITGVGLNICTDTELEEKTDYKASEVTCMLPFHAILGLPLCCWRFSTLHSRSIAVRDQL